MKNLNNDYETVSFADFLLDLVESLYSMDDEVKKETTEKNSEQEKNTLKCKCDCENREEDCNGCDGCKECDECESEEPTIDFKMLNLLILNYHIENVYFNDIKKTTTIKMTDGESITVRCCDEDTYDREVGLKTAMLKYLTGNTGGFNNIVNYWLENGVRMVEKKKKTTPVSDLRSEDSFANMRVKRGKKDGRN